jgi:peptide/nickel transport system substrate-binding protein
MRTGVVSLAAATVFLMSCGGSTSSSSPTPTGGGSVEPQRGGNLTFAISSYPQDMNPYSFTVDNISIAVFGSWWEYLVRPSADGSTFEPRLAESYIVSPDQKTYTFKLRSGVMFSDGSPLTTDDVVTSLHHAFTEKESQIAFIGPNVKSITAPDAQTVTVQLKKPWPYLLSDLSGFNAAILPWKLIDQEGYDTFLKHPIGTGPFALESTSPGSSIKVVRNTNYWDPGKPYLDSITFNVVPSDTARVTAVQGGQADLAENPPLNQLSSLQGNSQVRVYNFPSALVELIPLNVRNAPLDNVKLRQAISLAIDRETIVKTGLFGFATPATTFIVGPAKETLQNPNLDLYPFDLQRAEQLVKESGIPTPIKIDFGVSEGAAQDAIAAVMQQDLQKIGIDLNVIHRDFVSNENALDSGNFQANTTFWGDFIGDPSEQPLFWIDPAYCCDAYFTGYDNPQATALANQAVAETDPSKAQALFDDVQRSVADSAHAIPLYFPELTYVASPKLVGFEANPFGTYPFEKFGLTP